MRGRIREKDADWAKQTIHLCIWAWGPSTPGDMGTSIRSPVQAEAEGTWGAVSTWVPLVYHSSPCLCCSIYTMERAELGEPSSVSAQL